MMTAQKLRTLYIEFFKKHGHNEIPSAPLVPENDPTTLFNSSGMQPLVPNLLGEPHPMGKRLVNSQKAVRLQDIDEVGDNRHTTFFEMLGNWSLGDYFKKEQLPWVFDFLTKEIGLDPQKLYVTVFEGNESVPKDTDSIEIWKEIYKRVGIDAKEEERIFAYPAKKNWWSRSGEPENMPPGEPGGPDSEVFYDFGTPHDKAFGEVCHPNCDCGRFMEIGNSVFMQYQKQADGTLKELPQKNVDFGGGLERLVAAVNNNADVFTIDVLQCFIKELESVSKKPYEKENKKSMRIIADHIRAAIFLITDGVVPSNKQQGYVLRRLIRRALIYGRKLGLPASGIYISSLVDRMVPLYEVHYPNIKEHADETKHVLLEEAQKFGKTLDRGLREIEKEEALDGKRAFFFYESFGFPWEMTEEIAREQGLTIDKNVFEEEFKRHRDLSRTASKHAFKGGLADHSEETVKLHTATHLLHKALRDRLGTHVQQKGSNITAQRLRFDFSHTQKLTDEDIKEVEKTVNERIKEDLAVSLDVMSYTEAIEKGALAFFGERYGEKVKVYSIGNYSKEVCGGPHVNSTKQLGMFKIIKEESAGSGIRRIYAAVS